MGENKKKKDYKFIGLIAVEILFILTWIVLSFTGNKEIIHINWYANYTKNKSNFEIRDSKLKLNHVFQLIKILQTNPNIQDFKLEDYPNLMSVIVEKIN